jgi:hypothetical protein
VARKPGLFLGGFGKNKERLAAIAKSKTTAAKVEAVAVESLLYGDEVRFQARHIADISTTN